MARGRRSCRTGALLLQPELVLVQQLRRDGRHLDPRACKLEYSGSLAHMGADPTRSTAAGLGGVDGPVVGTLLYLGCARCILQQEKEYLLRHVASQGLRQVQGALTRSGHSASRD